MSKSLRRSLIPPERENHGDAIVIEPREVTSTGHATAHGARVQSAIERYTRRGQLTMRQIRAAETLYRAWALGIEGARLDAPGSAAWSPGGLTDAQVQAIRTYETARDGVGKRLWPLVFHVCCLDWTADRFANERARNSTATMEVLRYGLDMLADSLGIPEG